ncbi:copper homeostasis membrane protein CopD [Lichenibacterium dinghuense]|uniref:copper homeostasis membrane protein CopD n=1 Tax=Lichenibacterium dinghuense TaxID=2895977 RepID=UPI001F009C98|nr:copper homeostasis membrane protein CopD [Lichenibacterium sp. 6Y81]
MTSAAVDVTGVSALCRFAEDAAALLLWGAWATLAWLVPSRLAAAVGLSLRRATTAAIALALLAVAAKLPATAATIGDGWRDAADPGFVASVLADTGPGRAWAAQAAAAALLLAAAFAPRRLRAGATALAAALLLLGLTLTGHAAMHAGALGLFHRAVAAVHVLAAGAWLGALVPVLAILRALDRPNDRAEAVLALRRFSRAGHVAVALVVLSGVAQAALVLGRWPLDLGSPYEGPLDLKTLAVAGMAALALLNRYALVPRLGRDRASASAMLRRATLAEIPLGLVAVAAVAVFGLQDPN